MYSNNQWSFNPAVYQNIPYEQVDWASLAQQWIKMKETIPNANQGPSPPPAPQISKPEVPASTPTVPDIPSNDIEGGEAPMDMDTKDDDATPVGVAQSGNWNQWGNWQSQWGWGWSGNAGTVPSAETPSTTSVDSKVKSPNNDSIPALNDVRNFPIIGNTGTCTPQVPSSFNYNNTGGGMIPPILPKSNFTFDSTFTPTTVTKNTETWSKGKPNRQTSQKAVPTEQFPVMDAAKKKQLPAWIREGLNKMEREKQKKLERERMVQEKIIMDQMKAEVKEPEPAPVPVYVQIPPPQDPPIVTEVHKSPVEVKFQKRRSPIEPTRRVRTDSTASRKTKDQIMEESMLKVRRILTEILLEATEKQVHLIAKEEHRRFRSASALPVRKSNALSSLTGNLGLDVYDSEDNSSDGEQDRDDDVDSDEELKMIIDKKKRDFTLVEDEIDRLVEEQETKERIIAQQDGKDEDDNDDDDNVDDEVDDPKVRNNREKDASNSHRHSEYDKERSSGDKENRDTYRNRRRSTDENRLNGDSKLSEDDKARIQKKSKSPSRSSSSSSSTSTSSSSSANSSSDSSTSKSDRSGSSGESKKKPKKRKSHKKEKKSKNKKRRDSSESDTDKRSSSRTRYYDRYKRAKNTDSSEHKKSRRSPSYRRRSPSYHRSGRREQSSKYKESPSRSRRREYSPESKRSRYRSSSRDSRYKRR